MWEHIARTPIRRSRPVTWTRPPTCSPPPAACGWPSPRDDRGSAHRGARRVPRGVTEVLLTGLALACRRWRGADGAVLCELEGHGREDVFTGVRLDRTVGWFTSMYPARLDPGEVAWPEVVAAGPALGDALKRVKEQLRALPDHGLGYGMLRYLHEPARARLSGLPAPRIGFNYLGRFSSGQDADWELTDGVSTPTPTRGCRSRTNWRSSRPPSTARRAPS
ncbi:condensation domain-containing protein [Streptomyces nogalater]